MIFWAPVTALVFIVKIHLWLPSKILPIMCINTLVPLMISFVVWTPYCFEMKHVEIWIFFELVNQFYRYFSFVVCKRTIVTIVAFTSPIYVWCTELGLIFVRMIELLDSVVRFFAPIAFLALAASRNVEADLRLVST
jgi:hypothetical protein